MVVGVKRSRTWTHGAHGLLGLVLLAGCTSRGLYDDPTRTYADAGPRDRPPGRTVVRQPASLTGLPSPVRDPQGRTTEVACATCHAALSPTPVLPDTAEALGGPHAGMRFAHGTNACRSCHDPARFDGLRLASGETIPMTDAIRLCAQCHGQQHTAYTHGAHGGMNGHWDLSRGDRLRNHCVDCHDPHAPAFPRYMPMPPPRDTAGASRGAAHE